MVKIISSSFLKQKLTSGQLRSKVGNIKIYDKGAPKTLSGVGLKKFITTKFGGKTGTQIEKILKQKYGVAGEQIKKRESIMGLIRGDSKHQGLTAEQVKRNLRRSIDRDESAIRNKELHDTHYAGGLVQTKSIAVKSSMGDIGVHRGSVGFAQNYKDSKLPSSPPSQAPRSGVKPLGL
jgi:hypothetical protein